MGNGDKWKWIVTRSNIAIAIAPGKLLHDKHISNVAV